MAACKGVAGARGVASGERPHRDAGLSRRTCWVPSETGLIVAEERSEQGGHASTRNRLARRKGPTSCEQQADANKR